MFNYQTTKTVPLTHNAYVYLILLFGLCKHEPLLPKLKIACKLCEISVPILQIHIL